MRTILSFIFVLFLTTIQAENSFNLYSINNSENEIIDHNEKLKDSKILEVIHLNPLYIKKEDSIDPNAFCMVVAAYTAGAALYEGYSADAARNAGTTMYVACMMFFV